MLSLLCVVAQITMLAASTDIKSAVSICLLGWGLATAANVPLLEKLDVPKGPVVGSALTFLLLGELTRQGKLSAGIAGKILAALLIPVSLLEIASPKTILDSFKLPEASPLAMSLFENFSWTKLSTGMLLLVGSMTGKLGLGLAAYTATSAVNCIKTLLRADACGLEKPGLIVWTILQSAVALLAYRNEMA